MRELLREKAAEYNSPSSRSIVSTDIPVAASKIRRNQITLIRPIAAINLPSSEKTTEVASFSTLMVRVQRSQIGLIALRALIVALRWFE